jgi:hypothetical protein
MSLYLQFSYHIIDKDLAHANIITIVDIFDFLDLSK